MQVAGISPWVILFIRELVFGQRRPLRIQRLWVGEYSFDHIDA